MIQTWFDQIPIWAISLISAIIGAVVGAIAGGYATYLASNALEKEKRGATATVSRKDNIYIPIHDELASLLWAFEKPERWFGFYTRTSFQKWPSLKQSSDALAVPNTIRDRLNSLLELYRRYEVMRGEILQQITQAFPEKHLGYEDYIVANRLADRMLIFS